MASAQPPVDDERFTRRLESFGDLVFGFSLSLLATRLDVPATAADVFTVPLAIGFVLTFVIMCVLWLEHYRIFGIISSRGPSM